MTAPLPFPRRYIPTPAQCPDCNLDCAPGDQLCPYHQRQEDEENRMRQHEGMSDR